ncbi:hypothetical protein KCP77_07985 [Salmonella enterica subsp. enterica]|nr:hypothetical protein KCP77_07985 [Salmonella enterica subsp. enterica]
MVRLRSQSCFLARLLPRQCRRGPWEIGRADEVRLALISLRHPRVPRARPSRCHCPVPGVSGWVDHPLVFYRG